MKKNLLLLFTVLLFITCKSDDDTVQATETCDLVTIDSTVFGNATPDVFDFTDVSIDGDCLIVSFSYGGGCGDFSTGLVAEDEGDTTRNVLMLFSDNDDCEALLFEERFYNISTLQQENISSIEINIMGYDSNPIIYNY